MQVVVAVAPGENVRSGAAIEKIGTVPTIQFIIASLAIEAVIAVITTKPVGSGFARQGVIEERSVVTCPLPDPSF